MGSKRLYDFVHNNPLIEMHRNEYTNDPFIIAQNERMVAINSALSVDLTGQVCADSIGTSIFSGVGGQADFIRGAARSKGGRPIIALPSTAKDGKLSRILPVLEPGSGVVTTRYDVHYVATEFGVASLHGKNLPPARGGADRDRPPRLPRIAVRVRFFAPLPGPERSARPSRRRSDEAPLGAPHPEGLS